jgi:hypothetical protein
VHAKPEDPRRRQRRGYFGEGDHSINKDEVNKHQGQYEQQHPENILKNDSCVA